MIQDIIRGIATKLDAKYGHPVYEEHTKQGIAEPCFYIRLITSSEEPIVRQRYKRRQSFDVHYFPASDLAPGQEAHSVLEALYELLEYVPMGTDLVRAKSMRHELVDGVLHFFMDFELIIIKQETPEELMDDLHIMQTTV